MGESCQKTKYKIKRQILHTSLLNNINAFGGLGIQSEGFFFACDGFFFGSSPSAPPG